MAHRQRTLRIADVFHARSITKVAQIHRGGSLGQQVAESGSARVVVGTVILWLAHEIAETIVRL
jgi:hypothetical protein